MTFRATQEHTVLTHTVEGWDLRTEDGIEKCLDKWKKILRLQDWDITVELRRYIDLNGGEAVAKIRVNEWHRCATVYLLDPQDYLLANFTHMVWGYDMEDGLVHEFLHIHLFPYTPEDTESLEYTALEQSVSTITGALIETDRKRCLHKQKDKALEIENNRLRSVMLSMQSLMPRANQ